MATSLKSKRGASPDSGIKRAAIYVRVSSKGQEEDGTSLTTQEQRCREYAAERGYVVAEEHFYREVHTGTELWERPQLARMREVARGREVDIVVAFAIDRLSRDPVHMGVIISEADHAGVGVEFVTEPLDNSPEGQLIRFVRGYAAKVEHEKIKERTIRGRRARAEAGKLQPSRWPLYGYRWTEDRARLLPDGVTASVVQRVYRESLTGGSVRAIATGLTASGVPRPSGPDAQGRAAWGQRTVWLILTNPAYTGKASAWRHARSGGAQIALPENTIPALVDDVTFEAVQARLKSNQHTASRNNHDPEAALLRGGYVRCGYCGWAMHVQNSAPKGRPIVLYRCSRRTKSEGAGECAHGISTHLLDAAVWQHVEQILTQPDLIAAELERMRGMDPSAADLDAVERSLTQVVRQQRNLIEQLANVSGAAGRVIADKINALESQRDQLSAERETILGRARSWADAQEHLTDLKAWCQTTAANLGALTYQERRLALDALGVQARVWRTDHEPRYEIRASIPLERDIVCSLVGCRTAPSHAETSAQRRGSAPPPSRPSRYRCR